MINVALLISGRRFLIDIKKYKKKSEVLEERSTSLLGKCKSKLH